MADIRLTAGDDTYVQPEADKNLWNNVFGEAGNDIIRLYQGTAIGGAGNDRIEKIVDLAAPWRGLDVAYWDSPAGIVANLALGWVDDGFGTRDIVIGAYKVHGSWRDDRFIGDNLDNFFHPNGGRDTLDGGAGFDGFDVREIPPDASGQGLWRPARLDELDVTVTPDGLSATVSVKHWPGIAYSTVNMEYFHLIDDPNRYLLSDFITPQLMAEQVIAAGAAYRWNAAQPLGSAVTLSFSFVKAAPASGVGALGFRAFSASEQQAVREMLAATSRVAQIDFTEVAETGGATGQVRFGVSQQAQTKGLSWLPNAPGAGEQAGDVWMDTESMAGLRWGSEGWQALLHEIGHALGLRHPRNVDGGDAWPMQLRPQDDRLALSVMSQNPSADGLFRADWGPLDLLALRHLYGTREVGGGDGRIVLGAREAGAMTTILDDGGTDTLDASAMSIGVRLDLRPGQTSSAGLTPAGYSGVDNLAIAGSSWIEHAVGSAFDDVLLGNALDNALTGGPGNDWIDGGAGFDTAVYAGRRSDYELSTSFGKTFVRARDGSGGFDTLLNPEQLRFDDGTLALSATALGADGRFSTDEGQRLQAMLPDPSDVERAGVRYSLVGSAAHGSATVSADGQLSYMPQAGFRGIDPIAFQISGSGGSTNQYLAFVDVLRTTNAAPVAAGGTMLVAGSFAVQGRLPAARDADGDPVTYSIGNDSRNADVRIEEDGRLFYQAKTGYSGADSFSFVVSDGQGGTNVYEMTLTVVNVHGRLEGSDGNDVMAGRASADGYFGGAGDDRIAGGPHDDMIDGGPDIDTAIYTAALSAYALARTDFGWSVQARQGDEGLDRLAQVERLQFSNTALALDLDGHAGQAAQVIRALFGPALLANKVFVGVGLQVFDAGMAYADVVSLAMSVPLFEQLAGGRSHDAVVKALYKNVLGVAPSVDELAVYTGLLDAGVLTQPALALLACQLSQNTHSVELVGLAASGIEFTPAG